MAKAYCGTEDFVAELVGKADESVVAELAGGVWLVDSFGAGVDDGSDPPVQETRARLMARAEAVMSDFFKMGTAFGIE
ncbi:hypothetical protein [Glutamicibacter protophormiae]|uniref:Uncharacterized protein n=1 Tax=Glutamicibacter protophormiae TaxID=37930 RepID=A0ABS4XQZ2_GLUPR|nr:hypothetical protein [Glutamicibacter protophormiae]MBP2398924.1 hypothetical protein [Glutamicibacter protophormiae]GGL83635.1 hypothetical protein GCM10010038_11920 [Glutamicibacter protophormiae]